MGGIVLKGSGGRRIDEWLQRRLDPDAGESPGLSGAKLALIVGVGLLMTCALMRAGGLWIDPRAASDVPYYLTGSLAVALCVGLRRRATPLQRVVRDTAEYYATFTLIALIGAVASYPLAGESHGWMDADLARADAWLGFDWLAWYRLVAAHPVLQLAGRGAYETIYWTPAVILGAHALSGRQDRARAFLATFALAAAMTLALYRWMPAVGPLAFLWHRPIVYLPASALWQPQLIPMLRAGTLHVIDIGQLRGLVSAPSFHTAAAVLYVAGGWRLGRLRWPVAGVSAAMLLATPVEGTHYLSDMLIGAAVALLALAIARLLATAARRWARAHRPAAMVRSRATGR